MDAALNPDTVDERRGDWGRLLALFRLIHKGHQRGSSRRGAASYSIGTTLPRGTDNKGCRPRTVLHHRRAPKKLCARNAASASCCSHRVEHSHRAGPRVRRLSGGGRIRTLGPPVGDSIFSRPPRNPATTNRPGSQNRILTIDKGRFTVRRARLAPAMISTPGHRASRRRQRGALPAWSRDAFSAPSPN